MKKIVITGGPCAGKTSALAHVREQLARVGIPTFIVPEAATDLILDGIAPWTCPSVLDFQTRVVALQLERENAIEQLADAIMQSTAKTVAGENGVSDHLRDPVIVCDRGICDCHAYLTDEEYSKALAENGLDEVSALGRYDAVFHLESVAKDNPNAYTRQNNVARFEDADEAAKANGRGIRAWAPHLAFHVIGNYPTFEEKVGALYASIEDEMDAWKTATEETGAQNQDSCTKREPVLVSACLLGTACRYDGASMPCPAVIELADTLDLVPICPEQLGGLPTPRTPSEIQPDGRVTDRAGEDRTAAFASGADETLHIAREHGCRIGILKSRSPSCGVRRIYDGTFSGKLVPGQGVTASLLADAGITLLDETDFAAN
ncbi:MAG: DUF523 domain-containing protein [Eggerthellaceae bacterium]|nr:DUF523 domain-containing protein [Eggerthellaceae bacterium]